MTTNIRKLFQRYRKNTSGNFATIWAVSIGAVVFTVGAAYDVNQVSKAKQMAQMAADNMALTASIAVDFDNDDRFTEGQAYSYQYMGGPAVDFTDSMQGVVEYDVVDTQDPQRNPDGSVVRDENGNIVYNKLIARAEVTGTYETAFMGMMGINEISFEATADVAYAAREGSPASVFFTVDNSGSMGWDDQNGAHKLNGLKTSMRSFMNTLDSLSNHGENLFRTALYPYSQDYSHRYWDIDDDGVISGKVINPHWGNITNANINSMNTRAGTDSSGAMEDIAAAIVNEDAIHEEEHGDTPLKFVIFMSDGANNESTETQTVWVDEYWWRWRGRWWNRWKETRDTRPRRPWRWNHVAAGNQQQEVTGYWADDETKDSCDTIKASGAIIYSVGYALTQGRQYTGGRRNGYWVEQAEVNRAQSLLSYCASDEDHYILAEDANDLNEVFTEIGEEILKEVIRVKR